LRASEEGLERRWELTIAPIHVVLVTRDLNVLIDRPSCEAVLASEQLGLCPIAEPRPDGSRRLPQEADRPTAARAI
jgi:hypothetical protein